MSARDLAGYVFWGIAVLTATVNVIALAANIAAHVWGAK